MSDANEVVAHGGRIISGGMAATALATVIQLLQLETLSWLLIAALFCFAVALPFLVFSFTRYTVVPNPQHISSSALKKILISSSLITLCGLVFVFFHLNTIAGITFSVALGIAMVLEFVW